MFKQLSFQTRVVFTVLVLLGVGCSTEPVDPYSPLNTSSFISISQPGFELRRGDYLAWMGKAEILTDGSYELAPETLDRMQTRFEQRMSEQGFTITADIARADHWINAVIIIGAPISESELVGELDLSPSLSAAAQYDAGTLVLRLVHPESRRTQWRGAIEILTDRTQKQEDRWIRIDRAIDTFTNHLAAKSQ
ncbi:hypothetical protein [Gilvimarinus xylanilyticus]|uniref:DUF4136 domain-containing protein n=1 Tax=Gilvimarinus xylanilyticus TaxID=2944139 RepID=A0A9X2I5V9_9GAMM|nr:hypothetical protein [Gilvimarinus xylanilyticus]MCP8900471.1 hypothetical protein [Gilvimarinus xylanilyticus]